MIYAPLSYAVRSTEYPVAAGSTVSANGQALVGTNIGNIFGVSPSAGTAGEQFVGFVSATVSAAAFLDSTIVKVENAIVSAGGTVTLAFTPLASTTFTFDNTANSVVTPTVTGRVLSTLTAGNRVTVTYTYALTVTQAVALLGNQQPGGYAGAMIGSVGVAQGGRIFTSMFASGVNFATATSLKLAANGLITNQTGATGVVIRGFVVQIPTLEIPFLGIEYTV